MTVALAFQALILPDEAEAKSKYTKTQRLIVTAYTGAYSEGGPYTATGRRLRVGDCACSRNIPLGTRIYIPQLKRTLTCVDRYNKRLSTRIDVYMPSRKQAKQFGKQHLIVKILR